MLVIVLAPAPTLAANHGTPIVVVVRPLLGTRVVCPAVSDTKSGGQGSAEVLGAWPGPGYPPQGTSAAVWQPVLRSAASAVVLQKARQTIHLADTALSTQDGGLSF